MTPMEVCEGLGLYDLNNRIWHIQGTCALKGDGLYEGLDWLATTLDEMRASGRITSTSSSWRITRDSWSLRYVDWLDACILLSFPFDFLLSCCSYWSWTGRGFLVKLWFRQNCSVTKDRWQWCTCTWEEWLVYLLKVHLFVEAGVVVNIWSCYCTDIIVVALEPVVFVNFQIRRVVYIFFPLVGKGTRCISLLTKNGFVSLWEHGCEIDRTMPIHSLVGFRGQSIGETLAGYACLHWWWHHRQPGPVCVVTLVTN